MNGSVLRDSTDEELVQAHREGDPDAFGVLFERYKDRMWAVALRTTRDLLITREAQRADALAREMAEAETTLRYAEADELRATINATAVFDYPTIGGLAEYLVGQLPDAEPAAAPAADAEQPGVFFDTADDAEAALDAVTSRGLQPVTSLVRRSSLEDVFMSLLEQGAEDTQRGGDAA